MADWKTLTMHIEELLREGKRSQDIEFQRLFTFYGEAKIRDMVREIMKDWKKENGMVSKAK